MRKFHLLASALVCLLLAVPAQAQTRVFVAAQGSDSNPCTFAAPCRTFQHAHNAVAAGGEINVLDPAGYGPVTITKSISVQGHGFSGISVPSGGVGIFINGPETTVVNLSGLIIDGGGVGSIGIGMNAGESLTITDTMVRNFVNDGIALQPTHSARNSSIAVSRTFVANVGGNGIYFLPSPQIDTLVLRASFNHVEVHASGLHGIALFGGSVIKTSQAQVMVVDSVVTSSNGSGLYVNGGRMDVFHSTAFSNAGNAVVNGGCIILAQSYLATPNNLATQPMSGTCIASYGDNYTGNSGNPTPQIKN